MLKYLIILTLCVYGYLSFKKNNLNKEFYLVSLVSIIILLLFKNKTKNNKNVNNTMIDHKLMHKNKSIKKSPEELYHNFIDNLDKCGIFNAEDIPIILFRICLDVGYVYLKNNLYFIDMTKYNDLNRRIIQILNNDLEKKKITLEYPHCILDNLHLFLNCLQEFLDLFNKEVISNYKNYNKQLKNTNKMYFYYYIQPEVVDVETEEIIENFSNNKISFSLKFK